MTELHKFLDNKIVKFLITGISAFLLDQVILSFVSFVFFQGSNQTIGGIVSIPKLISASIALTFNFFLNRTWVFKKKNENIKNQGLKFIIVSLFNIIFVSIIYSIYYTIFTPIFDTFHLSNALTITFSNLSSEATKMIFSFLLYKYFVFK